MTMKRTLLFVSMISIAFGISAQSEFTENSSRDKVWNGKVKSYKDVGAKAPEEFSQWFNFRDDVEDLGGNYTQFYTMLFPDSTVQAEFDGGPGYVWKHSFGQILDPTSSIFAINSQAIDTNVAYTLDSIALPYTYNRIQTANPDTLLIQIFTHDMLSFVETPNWSTPRSYATAEYDSVARKGLNPAQEIVYLLEDKDTTTSTLGFISVAVGESVNADEVIAATFTYFPGNPFSKDDVVDFVNMTPDINGFAIYDGRDENSTLDNGYYNMGQMVTSNIRYNVAGATNGWEGQYIPGAAYGNSSGVRHLNVNFRISYLIDGINESNLIKYDLRSYPMPVENQFRVTFEPYNAQVAVYEIYDLNGTMVQSYRIDASTGAFDMDLTTLTDGFYVGKFILDNQLINSAKIVKK